MELINFEIGVITFVGLRSDIQICLMNQAIAIRSVSLFVDATVASGHTSQSVRHLQLSVLGYMLVPF
jgi:hypothetical protein